MLNQEKKEFKQAKLWPLGLAVFVVVVSWIYTFISFTYVGESEWLQIGDRGTFGDMFGGLNALFSGLAFATIIYTIYVQNIELLASQSEQKTQRENTQTQMFEHSFFSMLVVLNDIINSTDLVKKDGKRTTGRDCMRVFLDRLQIEMSSLTWWDKQDATFSEDEFNNHYKNWWNQHRTELGHYFRTLYNIVKFIHEANVKGKQKYANILRAQLSDQEQVLLFYNCLSTVGAGFKENTVRYALIKHVPDDLLFDPGHKNLYDQAIFSTKDR